MSEEDSASSSGSDPVDYDIDLGDSSAVEAFELALAELSNDNRELAMVRRWYFNA
jgi:hypothetical protein